MSRPASRRGTSNGAVRGNTRDRAARKDYLMRAWASDVAGRCRCYRCGCLLSREELTVDRIVPGCRGGTYARSNIRPACAACNTSTGAVERRTGTLQRRRRRRVSR